MKSFSKWAKKWDGQTGTNKAHFALQSFKWRITEPMVDIGGGSQFKLLLQSSVNAFTWEVPGQQNFELKHFSNFQFKGGLSARMN